MEVNIEHSEARSKPELEPSIDMPTQMKVQKKKRMREEKKKKTNPSESHAQHPQPQSCSNHAPAVQEIIEECPGPEGAKSSDGKPHETPVQEFLLYPAVAHPKIPDQTSQKDTATPIDQDKKVNRKNRKRNVAAASIEPIIQTGQDPPVDPATPVDSERMTKKSKKSVTALKNEGLESEKRNADLNAETAVQKIERHTAKKSMGRHNAEPAAKSPVRRTEHLKVTESPSKRHGDSSLRCEACQKRGHRLDQCKRLRRLSRKEESEPSIDMPTQIKVRKKKRMREEKKKETNSSESHAQHPQPQSCSNHAPAVREIIEECPGLEGAESSDGNPHETPVQEFLYPAVAVSIDPKIPDQASQNDTATPTDIDQKVSKKNRKSNVAAASVEPTIQTGQDPPVDPASPVDPERMTKKSKKSVSALKRLGSEKRNADLHAETAVQKIERPTAKKSMGRHNAEPAAKSPDHRTEHLKVTESPSKRHGDSSLSCEACQKHGHILDQCKRLRRLSRKQELEPSIDMPTQMKVQKKKSMWDVKKIETNPSESHAQHPQPQSCSNHAPAVREIIEECPGPEGAKSSDGKPHETLVQEFLYPAVALLIDPKIPDQVSRKDTATPIDQDQVSRKNRKSNVAAASIEPTFQTGQDPPVDLVTPVDPERMTKKSKKSVSALKNEGLESENRNADLNAETAVQKIERPTAKKSMGRHNAEPAAKSPVRRTEHLKVTESPSKRHGDSYLSCEACQKHGHRLDQCKRLRRLSRKQELEPSIDMPTQMKVQKKKSMWDVKKIETNPSESHAQHPQPQSCSNHAPAVREIIEECPGLEGAESSDGNPHETPVQEFLYPAVAVSIDPKISDQASQKDTATPTDIDQKVSKKNRKSNVAAASVEPTIQTGQVPPVDPASPVEPERMTKKGKKSVSALKRLESEKRNADLNAESAVQKIDRPTAKKSMGRHNAEPAAKSPDHRTEHLKVTESPSKRHGDSSLSCEACQKHGHRLDQCKRLRRLSRKQELESSIDMPTQMKVQKKKSMWDVKKIETNPSESHAQHPQPQSCSNHAPAVREIIEECPGPEGAESSDGKPHETLVQEFLYPAVALLIDPKIPDQVSRKDTATPIDQDQVSRKNRKSNVAAASIEPTFQTGQDPPVDPVTPVDPERMTKKSKKSVSALKNEGLESEKRNADLNAETAVQKIESPTAKKSMGRHNAEPAAKSPVRRTEDLKVTESPSKRHGDSSLSCEACQKRGHRLDQCMMLRRLSRNQQVCFFCGKIGHSLRKCGVTQAGGRFAKCLLCHEHGHFSYNCPQSENGKKRKELVANGAFTGTVETKEQPRPEV